MFFRVTAARECRCLESYDEGERNLKWNFTTRVAAEGARFEVVKFTVCGDESVLSEVVDEMTSD